MKHYPGLKYPIRTGKRVEQKHLLSHLYAEIERQHEYLARLRETIELLNEFAKVLENDGVLAAAKLYEDREEEFAPIVPFEVERAFNVNVG